MPDDPLELRLVAPDDPLVQAERQLRFRVLRDPLGLPPDAVLFDFEDRSLHLLAVMGNRIVGCVLFHPNAQGGGRLYQMAVSPELQGRGIGRALVAALEAELGTRGVFRVTLHAREQSVGFYERLGYRVVGEPFEEVGIPHRHMLRELGPASD